MGDVLRATTEADHVPIDATVGLEPGVRLASVHPVLGYPVEPGGLSQRHRASIERLAEKGWKSRRIAREIRKHPATVQLFLYRSGLSTPKPQKRREVFLRNGRPVVPFSDEEDDFIQALRVQGAPNTAIADAATRRFGHLRRPHTILSRLTMLVAREDTA